MEDDLISRQQAIDAIMELVEARRDWLSDASREITALDAAYCAIYDLPSIDAVPVVRCRDCVEYRRWDDECGECYDGLADGGMVRADGYCYAAKRKNDDIQK